MSGWKETCIGAAARIRPKADERRKIRLQAFQSTIHNTAFDKQWVHCFLHLAHADLGNNILLQACCCKRLYQNFITHNTAHFVNDIIAAHTWPTPIWKTKGWPLSLELSNFFPSVRVPTAAAAAAAVRRTPNRCKLA
jgi:hypothetical protein